MKTMCMERDGKWRKELASILKVEKRYNDRKIASSSEA